MTLLFFDGFDDRGMLDDYVDYDGFGLYSYAYAGYVWPETYWGIGFWPGRFGGNTASPDMVNNAGDYSSIKKYGRTSPIGPYNYWFFGAAVGGYNNGGSFKLEGRSGGSVWRPTVIVEFDTDGAVNIDAPGSSVRKLFRSNKSGTISADRWRYVAVYCGVFTATNTDFIKVWVDGELVIDESGFNFSLDYGTGFDQIPELLEIPYSGTGVDDLFCYASNSPITGLFTNARVLAMMPSAAGVNSDFTPSAGSNYQNVQEITQDFDTTTNSSVGTSGHRDDFEMDNLSDQCDTTSAVKGVALRALVTADAGEQIRLYLDIGGTRYYGTAYSPPNGSYGYAEYLWENNPATSSPWTVSELDAVKAGYEVV